MKNNTLPLLLLSGSIGFASCSKTSFTPQPPAPEPNPIARFSISGDSIIYQSITFANQSSDGKTYTWDLGDGTRLNNLITRNSIRHQYSRPGSYLVSLTAVNGSKSSTVSSQLNILIGSGRFNGARVFRATRLTNLLPGNIITSLNLPDTTISLSAPNDSTIRFGADELVYRQSEQIFPATMRYIWKTPVSYQNIVLRYYTGSDTIQITKSLFNILGTIDIRDYYAHK